MPRIICKILDLGSSVMVNDTRTIITTTASSFCKKSKRHIHGMGNVKFIGFDGKDDILGKILFGQYMTNQKKSNGKTYTFNSLMFEKESGKLFYKFSEYYFLIRVSSKNHVSNKNILTQPWSRSFRLSFAGGDSGMETLMVLRANDLVMVDGKCLKVDVDGKLINMKKVNDIFTPSEQEEDVPDSD